MFYFLQTNNIFWLQNTNDHGYALFFIITIQPFPHVRLVIGFVTRIAQWVPYVEQELLTLPVHLSSCCSIFSFLCGVFFQPLFGFFCFFLWSLHHTCMSFDLRLLITPLVSSNFSFCPSGI